MMKMHMAAATVMVLVLNRIFPPAFSLTSKTKTNRTKPWSRTIRLGFFGLILRPRNLHKVAVVRLGRKLVISMPAMSAYLKNHLLELAKNLRPPTSNLFRGYDARLLAVCIAA